MEKDDEKGQNGHLISKWLLSKENMIFELICNELKILTPNDGDKYLKINSSKKGSLVILPWEG